MRNSVTTWLGSRFRPAATICIILAGSALVAACSTSGGGMAGKLFGVKDTPDDISPEYFTRPAYCPPIEIRGGTQSLTLYERGHETEAAFVRYQASISKTARECVKTADGFAVKIGVAGRAVAGPKGGQGSLTLPLRVVVSKQGAGPLYSELFKVPVTIAPPALGADFSHVVQQVAVPAGPQERDFIIYVGFDEGKKG